MKTVVGTNSEDDEFTFTVTLTDAPISGTFGDMEFEEGVAEIILKGGEEAVAIGLPIGIDYTVEEEEANQNGYVTTSTGETGTICTSEKIASFTNTKDEGGLIVYKTVDSDIESDKNIEFEFTVTLKDGEEAADVNGTYGDMEFADGVAGFTLKDGGTAYGNGLPNGLNYEVVETDDDAFEITYSGETGTINTEKAALAVVKNIRKTGEIEISKSVISPIPADEKITYKFELELRVGSQLLNGIYGGYNVENGKVTINAEEAISLGATKFRCSIQTQTGTFILLTIKKETMSWPKRYTELGHNEDGWMTQKGVSDNLEGGMVRTNVESQAEQVSAYNVSGNYGWMVIGSTGEYVAGNAHRSIEIDLTADMISITYMASAYNTAGYLGGYAFLDEHGNYISGENTTVSATKVVDVTVPYKNGARKFRCSRNELSANYIELTIKTGDKAWPKKYDETGMNEDGWMTQKAVTQAITDGEVKILYIGNSLLQDSVAYLPTLLRSLAPKLRFKIYDWYSGGYTLTQSYNAFVNDTPCHIFSKNENGDAWTNYENSVTMDTILDTYDFDIIVLQEMMREESIVDTTGTKNVISYIKERYAKPLKVACITQAPVRHLVTTLFPMIVAQAKAMYEETEVSSIINVGGAIVEAMKTELDSLGAVTHLSADGLHAQEGLPCLVQSYVHAMWIFRQLGLPYGIVGDKLRITQEIYDAIHVPGPNLGTGDGAGVITGTDAQNYIAQLCAIKADKAAQAYERQAQDEMLTP